MCMQLILPGFPVDVVTVECDFPWNTNKSESDSEVTCGRVWLPEVGSNELHLLHYIYLSTFFG